MRYGENPMGQRRDALTEPRRMCNCATPVSAHTTAYVAPSRKSGGDLTYLVGRCMARIIRSSWVRSKAFALSMYHDKL